MRCYVDMLLITSTANIKTWERDNGLYGGLFPLVRETLGIGAIAALCVRFIPADVGNTQQVQERARNGPVYPRWRGEHSRARHQSRRWAGLSPLARGTRSSPGMPSSPIRFIPAGAGNTRGMWIDGRQAPVYPRWRGEHMDALYRSITSFGLSPLARGTRWNRNWLRSCCRFIPAGAGNTILTIKIMCWLTVYPRWRGEHFLFPFKLF